MLNFKFIIAGFAIAVALFAALTVWKVLFYVELISVAGIALWLVYRAMRNK